MGHDLLGSLSGKSGGTALDVLEELRSLGLDFSEGGLSDRCDLGDNSGDLGSSLTSNIGNLFPEVSEKVSNDSLVVQTKLGNDQAGQVGWQDLVDGLDSQLREIDLRNQLLGNGNSLFNGRLGLVGNVAKSILDGLNEVAKVDAVSIDCSVDSIEQVLDGGLELLGSSSTDLLKLGNSGLELFLNSL